MHYHIFSPFKSLSTSNLGFWIEFPPAGFSLLLYHPPASRGLVLKLNIHITTLLFQLHWAIIVYNFKWKFHVWACKGSISFLFLLTSLWKFMSDIVWSGHRMLFSDSIWTFLPLNAFPLFLYFAFKVSLHTSLVVKGTPDKHGP